MPPSLPVVHCRRHLGDVARPLLPLRRRTLPQRQARTVFRLPAAADLHLAEFLLRQVVLDLEDNYQSLSEFAVHIPVSSVLLAFL